MHRFTRTELLLGNQAFSRLTKSHVAVFGLGAVGGYAVEGLARAGVGRLTLVDFDLIQPTNINRQILALESTLGQPKVEAAAARVADINPQCRIKALNRFVDQDSAAEVLDGRPDFVIDAIDSLNPKVQLLLASHRRGLRTFSSMGAALRTDPAQIRIGDIAETRCCPLARRIRKRLKKEGIISGITCIYSTEAVDFDYQLPAGAEDTQNNGASESERGRARPTLGSLPTLTAIFGLMLANEVIRQIRVRS